MPEEEGQQARSKQGTEKRGDQQGTAEARLADAEEVEEEGLLVEDAVHVGVVADHLGTALQRGERGGRVRVDPSEKTGGRMQVNGRAKGSSGGTAKRAERMGEGRGVCGVYVCHVRERERETAKKANTTKRAKEKGEMNEDQQTRRRTTRETQGEETRRLQHEREDGNNREKAQWHGKEEKASLGETPDPQKKKERGKEQKNKTAPDKKKNANQASKERKTASRETNKDDSGSNKIKGEEEDTHKKQ